MVMHLLETKKFMEINFTEILLRAIRPVWGEWCDGFQYTAAYTDILKWYSSPGQASNAHGKHFFFLLKDQATATKTIVIYIYIYI